jgi:hypothetical protein
LATGALIGLFIKSDVWALIPLPAAQPVPQATAGQ